MWRARMQNRTASNALQESTSMWRARQTVVTAVAARLAKSLEAASTRGQQVALSASADAGYRKQVLTGTAFVCTLWDRANNTCHCADTEKIACMPCLQGYYPNSTEDTECTPCVEGKYASSTAMSDCAPCSTGMYSANEASAACEGCPQGKFAASNGLRKCTDCPSGKYQKAAGQGYCTNCQARSITDTRATTSELSSASCVHAASGQRAQTMRLVPTAPRGRSPTRAVLPARRPARHAPWGSTQRHRSWLHHASGAPRVDTPRRRARPWLATVPSALQGRSRTPAPVKARASARHARSGSTQALSSVDFSMHGVLGGPVRCKRRFGRMYHLHRW
jgi:hypothetical protein